MSREVFVVERRKDKSGWLIMLLAAVLIAYWPYIFAGAIMAAIAWLTRRVYRSNAAKREARISKDAATALRADHEHQQWLEANLIEGNYPGTTMPITGAGRIDFLPDYSFNDIQTVPQVMYREDFDDGLRNWQ